MKEPLEPIEAIPSKRIYLSIIADYHLHLALCELIDNAIDNWIFTGRKNELEISIDLDYDQQTIQIKDNSGGIKEEDISLIVAPGHSRENTNEEIIGVFGVGSKRAVISLAQEVKIYSRFSNEKTILIEFNDKWIGEEDNWHLPTFEVSPIDKNTTQIELSVLREKIEEDNHENLIEHLGATYALFLEAGGLTIRLNDDEIVPITFENWSYPTGYEPQEKKGPINFRDLGEVNVSITGGLIQSHKESGTSNDEYGVYFYCNERLISRAYKGTEVGFKPPRIGRPHPSMSLARIIVKMTGPVELMPWNSSKSEIDFKHKAFHEITGHIERFLFAYASMSRGWSGEWPEKIFQFNQGTIKTEILSDISSSVRLHVPRVTRSPRKPKFGNLIKSKNRDLARNKPWIVGLYEAIIAVEELKKLKLQQNNRLSLLIIDSTLEIGFKEYLLNETEDFSESQVQKLRRHELHTKINENVELDKQIWKAVNYYYRKRCHLVHRSASDGISDEELKTYREKAESVLQKLFGIKF